MDKQTAVNVGIVLLMIAGFTINAVYDPVTGDEFIPTHYCQSTSTKMYCARTTTQYCRPSLTTTKGSKRCLLGWKEIPEPVTVTTKVSSSGSGGSRFVCDKIGCTATS